MRREEREARAYCESIGADPDELIWGGWGTGDRIEWLQAPRWTWYRGANPEWDRPLTAYEKAQIRQQPKGGFR